jgi:hypothetical protein
LKLRAAQGKNCGAEGESQADLPSAFLQGRGQASGTDSGGA